jgi:type II secretory pathway component GspD/PulD (secretin)
MTHLRTFAALRAGFLLALIAPLTLAFNASAQTDPNSTATESKAAPELTQTIFLINATTSNDINDIQTTLRNTLPRVRVYAASSQSAITIRGTADEQAEAQRLIGELDRPRESYRLTYTLTDYDGSKSGPAQRVSLILRNGSRATLKQGTRVPIVTGGTAADYKAPDTQVQYIDIGLDIDAKVSGSPGALSLETRVEQSSLAGGKSIAVAPDPVIQLTTLNEVAQITAGKPLLLGSLDLSGSTHHLQVEVVAEPMR